MNRTVLAVGACALIFTCSWLPATEPIEFATRIRRLPPVPTQSGQASASVRPAQRKMFRLPPVRPTAQAEHPQPPHVQHMQGQHIQGPVISTFSNGMPIQSMAPWWTTHASQPILGAPNIRQIDLDTLLIAALHHSPRVLAIADAPLIRETAIVEAAAAFDPASFLDTKFRSLSDPVGNTLTTGGPSRLHEKNYEMIAGVRKKTERGSTVEFSQQLGTLTNNSVFLTPQRQGNARLSLSYTHPVLRGAGKAYNRSLIVLAEFDTRIATERAVSDVQDHLQDVAVAYETLKLNRAGLAQKRRLVASAQAILSELEARHGFDSSGSQVARARAAVAMRQADLARAASEIKNTQTQLNVLVQSPDLFDSHVAEFIPTSLPPPPALDVNLDDALVTALHHRTEVTQGINRLRAAEVRMTAAQNESLPTLDLVLEGYVAGLAPSYQTATAFSDQFSEGQPGFTAGIVINAPWNARAAKSRHRRRQLEYRRIMNEFQQSLVTIRGEVEVAIREVQTANREMAGHWRAMEAAQADIRYMEERWQKLPRADGARGFLLEDLLKAQERLAKSEYELAATELRYATSLIDLKRSTGTLLHVDTRNLIQCRAPGYGP